MQCASKNGREVARAAIERVPCDANTAKGATHHIALILSSSFYGYYVRFVIEYILHTYYTQFDHFS